MGYASDFKKIKHSFIDYQSEIVIKTRRKIIMKFRIILIF